jgi:hypothetical protein
MNDPGQPLHISLWIIDSKDTRLVFRGASVYAITSFAASSNSRRGTKFHDLKAQAVSYSTLRR